MGKIDTNEARNKEELAKDKLYGIRSNHWSNKKKASIDEILNG